MCLNWVIETENSINQTQTMSNEDVPKEKVWENPKCCTNSTLKTIKLTLCLQPVGFSPCLWLFCEFRVWPCTELLLVPWGGRRVGAPCYHPHPLIQTPVWRRWNNSRASCTKPRVPPLGHSSPSCFLFPSVWLCETDEGVRRCLNKVPSIEVLILGTGSFSLNHKETGQI